MAILLMKFVQELAHLAQMALVGSESDIILGVLTLVDLSLTGSLLLIVIFSGYENFVSKIDHSGHRDWPEWMGTIDFTGLKLKLLWSIVAISAIQLSSSSWLSDRLRARDHLVRDHPRRLRGIERAAGAFRLDGRRQHGKPANGNGGADHGGGHGGGPAGGHGNGPSGDGKPEAKSQQTVRKGTPAAGLPVRPPFTPPVRRKLH